MSKTEKKRANKEIATLAALKDADIDTSDIPEVKDWSGAVEGRFYRPKRQSILHLEQIGRQAGERGNASWSRYTQMTTSELAAEFLQGTVEAHQEVIRRLRGGIASFVTTMAVQKGDLSPELLDGIVEEVCRRLTADNYRILRAVSARHKDSRHRTSHHVLVVVIRTAQSVARIVAKEYFSNDSATDLSSIRKTL